MSTKRTTIRAIALLTLALTSVGCSKLFSKKAEAVNTSTANVGTAGIKNVSQLAPAMAAVTGVSSSELDKQAKTIAPWLSTDGSVTTVNSSMLMAITGLAGMYCHAFIAKEASLSPSQRRAHASVDFAAGPGGLTAASEKSVMQMYARLFWQRDPTDDEITALIDSLNEAIQALPEPQNSSDSRSSVLQNALLVPCTAALSSLDFIKA